MKSQIAWGAPFPGYLGACIFSIGGRAAVVVGSCPVKLNTAFERSLGSSVQRTVEPVT